MRPPGFWAHGGAALPALLLSPVAGIVAGMTARRVARPGWQAPVPVICCGNAGLGGAGKTTVVIDLASRLMSLGRRVHLLTRGYGGRLGGPLRVDPERHDARDVGDEALLLAETATVWLGAGQGCHGAGGGRPWGGGSADG